MNYIIANLRFGVVSLLFIMCCILIKTYDYIIIWHIYITYLCFLVSLILCFYWYEKIILIWFMIFLCVFWADTNLGYNLFDIMINSLFQLKIYSLTNICNTSITLLLVTVNIY